MTVLAELRDRLADPRRNWGRLPDVTHMGDELKTLDDVRGVMGVDAQTAALAILQSKDAGADLVVEAKDVYAGAATSTVVRGVGTRLRHERLVRRAGALVAAEQRRRKRRKKREKALPIHATERKALHGQPDSDFDSICVMLDVAPKSHYAWPGGIKPEHLHVTVCYYGKLKDYEGNLSREDWIMALKHMASNREQFIASLGGIIRFSAKDEDGRDPIVMSISANEVEDIRRDVTDVFGRGPSNYGYTPHMTVAYIDQDDEMPIQRQRPEPIIVTGFKFSWGREVIEIPFLKMGTLHKEEEEDV